MARGVLARAEDLIVSGAREVETYRYGGTQGERKVMSRTQPIKCVRSTRRVAMSNGGDNLRRPPYAGRWTGRVRRDSVLWDVGLQINVSLAYV